MNLDSLNDKLKAKEFKATAKSLKAKELPARMEGIEKLKDVRYFIEGNVLPSLLESTVIKKVCT